MPEQIEFVVHIDHELNENAGVLGAAPPPDEIAVVVLAADLDFVEGDANDDAAAMQRDHRDAVGADIVAQLVEIEARFGGLRRVDVRRDGGAFERIE